MHWLIGRTARLLGLAAALFALAVQPALGYAAQNPSVYVTPDGVSASAVLNRALCTQAESDNSVYLALYAGNGGPGAERWCSTLLAAHETVAVDPGQDLPHDGPNAVVSECALVMPDPEHSNLYSWGAVWSTPQGVDDAVDQCSLLGSILTVTWRDGLQPAATDVVPVECSDGWASARGAQPDACARHGGVEGD
jgi:hypothetical protein